MSFSVFSDQQLKDLVGELSQAKALSVIAGAGASMESLLPSWSVLIERVLDQASKQTFRRGTDEDRSSWASQLQKAESLLGAASVVQAMYPNALTTWIEWELYEGRGAASFLPGPIAHEIARLKLEHSGAVELITVNYDDLLEEALNLELDRPDAEAIAVEPRGGPAKKNRVIHLHGFSGRREKKGPLVLSEADYQRMADETWQERFMVKRLQRSNCLFVGTSLTDPNLIRYLYKAATARGPRHAAVFARQSLPRGHNKEVQRELEHAIAVRWRRANVRVIFVDHYADVAAVLQQIRLTNAKPGLAPLPERAAAWVRRVEEDVLKARGSDSDFERAQRRLSAHLRQTLTAVEGLARRQGFSFDDERLAVGLWLANEEGTELTNWTTSDRIYTTARTLSPVPVSADSEWVGVQAFARGVPVQDDPESYSSRWKYVRGLPLSVSDRSSGGRLLVGSLTLTSNRPGEQTELERLDDSLQTLMHQALLEAAETLLS